ncbi:hypothetical protein G7047_05615 [Diaphorobacter sp. HDW4A]|uniref:hypothetical protein n=1 Tax=Diaphorobacter sp. HDW4A TaxID=2714924 RepID=UPI00140D6D68|nr:hypothetical protein [Diaphorobacter sp. HDW4A]QIL79437.1 hypothetical protein G7047_05615 [Diaphorobacter sp. HDW4A]
MFQRFMNPTIVYMRRIQSGLEEARMAALEHESAAEHHAALATMYRERTRRLQAEMAVVNEELAGRTNARPADEPQTLADVVSDAESAAAQVHRITPRVTKREEAALGPNPQSLLPQGAAG